MQTHKPVTITGRVFVDTEAIERMLEEHPELTKDEAFQSIAYERLHEVCFPTDEPFKCDNISFPSI